MGRVNENVQPSAPLQGQHYAGRDMKPIEKARADLNAAQASEEHADFMKTSGQILSAGMNLKKIMIDKKLTAAKAKCPVCEHGFIHGRLAGRKNHLRMWCDGEGCNVMMME